MQNILRFIGKYHFFLLFLFFEVIAFYLIVNYNNKHKEIFLNSSNSFSSFFLEISGGIKGYFLLKQANEELSRQNTYLRMLLSDNEVIRTEKFIFLNELPDSCRFIYQSARVINNSVNKGSNYITINLGSSSNIKPGTGLISARGLVGIVTNVSKNYSVAISLLNTKFRVSAKLRNSEYFGSLTWDGKSYQHAILREIPAHASVQVGEAIVTSGYSAIFPETEDTTPFPLV